MTDYDVPSRRRELSIPNVFCSDGQYRVFRRFSLWGDNGFVRVDQVSVTGRIELISGTKDEWRFVANPRGKNYEMLPTNPTELLRLKIAEVCLLARNVGFDVTEPQISTAIGLIRKSPTHDPIDDLVMGTPTTPPPLPDD